MNNVDWNDLRYLVAVSTHGSASAAAKVLGVSHATVLRRIQMLENGVGARLFDRLQTGYMPTEPGKRFLELGEAFERALRGTQREVEGQATDLAGTIRFTTTDSLAYSLMPQILAGFRKRYPAIIVEMRITNARLDLETREADVALRPTRTPPQEWVGRPVARLGIGLYASPAYLQLHAARGAAPHDWLMLEGPLDRGPLSQWMRNRAGNGAIVASADSFVILRQLALKDLGVTVLPSALAAGSDLVLLERLPDEMVADLWLLTHPDLRHMGRIRAFMEHVAQAMPGQL